MVRRVLSVRTTTTTGGVLVRPLEPERLDGGEAVWFLRLCVVWILTYAAWAAERVTVAGRLLR